MSSCARKYYLSNCWHKTHKVAIENIGTNLRLCGILLPESLYIKLSKFGLCSWHTSIFIPQICEIEAELCIVWQQLMLVYYKMDTWYYKVFDIDLLWCLSFTKSYVLSHDRLIFCITEFRKLKCNFSQYWAFHIFPQICTASA